MVTNKSGDALVDFATMWEPFGGAPPEDVFIEFGVYINEYKRRLFARLSTPDLVALIDPALRIRLVDYCVHANDPTQHPHR